MPANLLREALFEDEFVCVVAKENPWSASVMLKQYLDARHVGITIFNRRQTVPEKRLAEAGFERHRVFNFQSFSLAARSAEKTDLVATVPKAIAVHEAKNAAVKILKAPKAMGRFKYLRAWHPRMDNDAAHIWLRSAIREVAKATTRSRKRV